MCIISDTVKHVAQTKLFTCPYNKNSRQMTVYSNKVHSLSDTNTMILPVPNPNSIEFVNLEKYPKFFDDCENSFYRIPSYSYNAYATRSLECGIASLSAPLKVHSVGSYDVSIVNHVPEFSRLNPLYFTIGDNLIDMLSKTYGSEFGYLVCKLKEGDHDYHPFAYTHDLHTNSKVFLPTLHYHLHEYSSSSKKYADWDHLIYSIGTSLKQDYEYRFSSHKVKFSKLPEKVRSMKEQTMTRCTMIGDYPNKDMWLDCKDTTPTQELTPTQLSTSSPPPLPEPKPQPQYDFPVDGKKGLENLRRAFRNGF
jgi:hypothetical protein